VNPLLQPIKILSPAKINLFLCVIGKRADGYHDLATLMCCIGLYDIIVMDFDRDAISVHCDNADVPNGETNLAYRAATIFYDELKKNRSRNNSGVSTEGVAISIEKKIPVAAGLGGGSSNAASVLAHLNRYHGQPFSPAELNALGRDIGADVPFFLLQKPAIATGIGEKLKKYNRLKPLPLLLVCPNFHVSTQAVYKNLNLGLTKCENKLKKFLFDNSVFDAKQHLCNDLEAVTISAYPELHEIKENLLRLHALGALMTGSGPAVFGIYADKKSVHHAFDELRGDGRWRLYIAEMLL
jgi:4-diphosphocytidyl-2-C-methyl-D-erythritol kinase